MKESIDEFIRTTVPVIVISFSIFFGACSVVWAIAMEALA